eukprot:TRINITY_DN36257_c0_g1_i1.p3 TRINITY_DN36257_c0_g1~~TRINITY_DN36257_c0_g1_i1.p3  ORF type:complete len:103 (-),score=30.02 TRINITY_DN36257_c0_g1_i1:259-567(-)
MADDKMPTNKELEQQLAAARKDIETLARMAGTRAKGHVADVQSRAVGYMEDLSDEARAVFDSAQAQGYQARDLAEEKVRENPLMAMGLAVGAGFILAGLMRK